MSSSLLGAALLLAVRFMPSNPIPGGMEYVFPVSPAAKASFGKGGHPYPAVDIFAPEGTPFVAPVSGIIEDLENEDHWNPKAQDPALKGGRWVSLLGNDGFRYYGSHLKSVAERLRKGQRVEAGTELGSIGAAGNARGTPSHLHFGISRASRPYTWMIRRGEMDPVPILRCLLKKGCDPAGLMK